MTNFIFAIVIALLSSTSVFAADVLKSTIDDQRNVEVTVYNSNLGLIKEIREISVPQGEGELRFEDVASQIMPVTVHIESLSNPEGFGILEQNYEYDLMDSNKLLDKYVGKKIKIVDPNPYQDKKEILNAELLSNNNGQIYKIDNEIYLGCGGYKVLPEIPENLIARPTLMWLYKNARTQKHDVQVSYLTAGINWKADYIFVLDSDDAKAKINGWVSLDNQSGTGYKNAKLKLVAGEVNRDYGQAQGLARGKMALMEMAASAPQFSEQSFFEYHIYDLERPTTIKDKQTKQISLLEANDVKTKKEFIVDGNDGYFYGNYAGQDIKTPVQVKVSFKNSEDNHMGMPLPEGTMRFYKKDQSGSLQFIGEDHIDHTPKDEEVKLKLGEAFDIVCERVQKDYKIISSNIYETAWEVTLRNHKKEDEVVSINEPINAYSQWKILESSLPYQKTDAFHIKFDVPVPKDGEVTLTYRVQVKLR